MGYEFDKFIEAGWRIRFLRNVHGIKQKELLEMIHERGVPCKINRLSAMENGDEDQFSLKVLLALCDIFGCEIGYLLCDYDERSKSIHDLCAAVGFSEESIEKIMRFLQYQKFDISHEFLPMLNRLIESNRLEFLLEAMCRYGEAVDEARFNQAMSDSVPVLSKSKENAEFSKFRLSQQWDRLIDDVFSSDEIMKSCDDKIGSMKEKIMKQVFVEVEDINESSES